LPNKVAGEVKQRRLSELQAVQKEITQRKNQAWEGREVEVLVEGPSKAKAEERTGRTRTNRIVNFPGESVAVGALVKVRVRHALAHSLKGELL
jgi:tRNA-2-methylthio-N6-dimethylallyladenosine synthase